MRDAYRVPLAGCLNFRDLGGYACAGGQTTQAGKLYRSNCLSGLTDADIAAIEVLGINGVVDLRFPDEAEKAVNRLCGRNGVMYANISIAETIQMTPLDFPASMAQFYIDLARKSGPLIAEVFRFFADHANRRFVFHCTAGKDRTGVIAALLLDLVGVSHEDIVADYILTQEYTWDTFMRMKAAIEAERGFHLDDYIFEARAESMEAFLAELYASFGGTAAYLKKQGLTDAALAAVQGMLLV